MPVIACLLATLLPAATPAQRPAPAAAQEIVVDPAEWYYYRATAHAYLGRLASHGAIPVAGQRDAVVYRKVQAWDCFSEFQADPGTGSLAVDWRRVRVVTGHDVPGFAVLTIYGGEPSADNAARERQVEIYFRDSVTRNGVARTFSFLRESCHGSKTPHPPPPA